MGKDADRTGRRLTQDELKAAEAAFQGSPFNEAWSVASRTVYDGIVAAKIRLAYEPLTRGQPAPKRDPQGTEDLVGLAVHCSEGEGFNGF